MITYRSMTIMGCFILVMLLCFSRSYSDENNDPIILGYKDLAEGKIDAALMQFNSAILADPNDAEAYRYRGTAYERKNDYSLALKDLTKAIELNPKDAKAFRNRAVVLGKMRRYGQAISDCNEAIKLDTTDVYAYIIRAGISVYMGRNDDCIADCNEAIRINPKIASIYTNRSGAYIGKGDLDSAFADCEEAIKLEPRNAIAYANRGCSLIGKGDCEKGIADCTEAIRLNAQCAIAYFNRGRGYSKIGQWHNALKDFTDAIQLDATDTRAFVQRCGIYANQGDWESALSDIDKAISLQPQSSLLYEIRGILWIRQNDYDRGMKDIQKAVQMNPNDSAATFESSTREQLATDALNHGQEQLQRMLNDRPVMKQYNERSKFLYDWAIRKFAGEDLHRRIFWDSTDPPFNYSAANHSVADFYGSRCIQVAEKFSAGQKKGENLSFEDLWSGVVYELFNCLSEDEIKSIWRQVEEDKISKNIFATNIVACEFHAAQKTRAFYIHVILPWAKENRIPTTPESWYLGRESIIHENIHNYIYDNPFHLDSYEQQYDLLKIRALLKSGEYQKGVDYASELIKKVKTSEEKCKIGILSGWGMLKLNNPKQALDLFNEIIRYSPNNKEIIRLRAMAYLMLKDGEHALADSSEAIRLDPKNPHAYLCRSEAYLLLGEKEKSEEDAAKAKNIVGIGNQNVIILESDIAK